MCGSKLDYEELIFGSPGGKIISTTELKAVLKYLRPKKSEKILDIGTGTGRIARKVLLIPNVTVVGIDLNKQHIRCASTKKKRLRDHGNRYQLVIADGRFLPFRDSSFHSVICIRTLKYFLDYKSGIEEISRVLKNHGKLVLTLSNIFSIDIVLLKLKILAYKRLFNFRKTLQFFKENNLVLVNYTGLHKIHPKIWSIFTNAQWLNFLKRTEDILQKITPKELFSREILVKFVKKRLSVKMMMEKIEIKDLLKKYVKSIVKRGKIGSIPLRSEGLSSTVYTFSLIYPKNNFKREKLEFILKMYNKGGRAVCYKESEILSFLHSKGFPVPRLYIKEISDKILGKPFIIIEKVNGEPMGKYLKRVNDDNLKRKVIKCFAETLAFLHSLAWDDLSFSKHPPDKYSYAKYQILLVQNLQSNLRIKGDFSWIITWMKSNAPLHPCQRYSILHGDMHLDNFLISTDGRIVMLDWEYPEIGDPLRDVALAYINLIFAFGFRKLSKGKELGEFFVHQYVKRLNRKLDSQALRFYIVASALVEVIFYRFNCKQAHNPYLAVKRFGIRYLPAFPFLCWYFWWRARVLEQLIIEEIKAYERFYSK